MAIIKVPKKTDVMLLDGSQGMVEFLPWGTDRDVRLYRDAANVLALRNGATEQALRLYEVYTSAADYSRLAMFSLSDFALLVEHSGSGAERNLVIGTTGNRGVFIRTSGTNRWQITNAGHAEVLSDNVYDFGGGSLRPRTGRFGTSVEIADHEAIHGRLEYKEADQSLNTSTTLQNDTSLSKVLAASTTYAFKFWVFTNSQSAAEGIKFALNGTVGVTSIKAVIQIFDDTLDTAVTGRVSALGSSVASALSTGENLALIAGTIETSTTGTLLLQWAQNVSGGNNTTVQRGSFMSVERIP